MSMKEFITRLCLIAIIFCAGFDADAQKEDEIAAVRTILVTELKKAGVELNPDKISLGIDKGNAGRSDGRMAVDAFSIQVSNNDIQIRSGSVEGLRNGVYWYLGQLGFRFFMPGELWHYVPKLTSAFRPMKETVNPSFTHRRIWYAYGTGSDIADADYRQWSQANLLGGEEVNTGHSYDAIVNRNKAEFLKHPEYFAQKVAKGKIPSNPKFDVTNRSLVDLVVRDAFKQIEQRLKETGELPGMISMDPSDGGGFSTSAASLKIGGPGEQTFYLANTVAKAVREKYPTVRIGLYAYNLHAAPPKFDLEPNIVVLVATALNQSAFRTDELIDLWKKKGAQVGIRDYYGVMAWDWDMPGQPKGSRIAYVNQLKDYYKQGIRFVSAETNIGWISRGLGHYTATRLLWDVKTDPDKIQDEFFESLFPVAEDEMEELFKKWQKYTQPVPQDADLYEWLKLLEKATKKNPGAAEQKRLDKVKQYLHYVSLFKQWKAQDTDDNLVALLNYAYRVQDEGIVASYPLFRRIANAAVAGKANMRFNDPKAKWKTNNSQLSTDEIRQHFLSDMAALSGSKRAAVTVFPAAGNFKTIENRLSARGVNPRKGATSNALRLRGVHKIILQVRDRAAFLNISSGLIKAREYKTLRLSVYAYQEDLGTDEQQALMTETIQPKQPTKAIALSKLKPGVYIAVIDDAKAGFTFSVTGDIDYGILSGEPGRIWTFGRNNLVFNVGNAKEFQVRNEGVMTLVSPAGRKIDLQNKKGLITVQVEAGETGTWKVQRQSGVFYLQGILPFVCDTENFLLRKEND
jgi:hypothetical protein